MLYVFFFFFIYKLLKLELLKNFLQYPTHLFLLFFLFFFQTYKHPEFRGPHLGPRPAEENKREFSEDTLRASEAIIGLQAGTNRGANQSGLSFGKARKIIIGK